MTKLCPRGKAAAKRKFKVYPSAYANAYASKICAGKIKDPSGVKRKDFRGSKAKGGRIGYKDGDTVGSSNVMSLLIQKLKEGKLTEKPKRRRGVESQIDKKLKDVKSVPPVSPSSKINFSRKERAGGGLMEATARLKKQGLKGGGISQRGLGRAFMKGGRV